MILQVSSAFWFNAWGAERTVPVPEDLPRFRATLDFSDMEGDWGKNSSDVAVAGSVFGDLLPSPEN